MALAGKGTVPIFCCGEAEVYVLPSALFI